MTSTLSVGQRDVYLYSRHSIGKTLYKGEEVRCFISTDRLLVAQVQEVLEHYNKIQCNTINHIVVRNELFQIENESSVYDFRDIQEIARYERNMNRCTLRALEHRLLHQGAVIYDFEGRALNRLLTIGDSKFPYSCVIYYLENAYIKDQYGQLMKLTGFSQLIQETRIVMGKVMAVEFCLSMKESFKSLKPKSLNSRSVKSRQYKINLEELAKFMKSLSIPDNYDFLTHEQRDILELVDSLFPEFPIDSPERWNHYETMRKARSKDKSSRVVNEAIDPSIFS